VLKEVASLQVVALRMPGKVVGPMIAGSLGVLKKEVWLQGSGRPLGISLAAVGRQMPVVLSWVLQGPCEQVLGPLKVAVLLVTLEWHFQEQQC